MLEPMNPYERRIIHSEIQGVDGVSTNSIGSENNRRVVMFLDDSKKAGQAPVAEEEE
jgi:spoIIIJ-associated protein